MDTLYLKKLDSPHPALNFILMIRNPVKMYTYARFHILNTKKPFILLNWMPDHMKFILSDIVTKKTANPKGSAGLNIKL